MAKGDVLQWAGLRMEAVNLRDSVSATLEEMIVGSNIADGTRLPPERELAAGLGVSRTSLRDALRQLELKGLIDRRPGRGTTIVAPESRQPAGDLLENLSAEERTLREVMDLRASIEPPIAARAAARATPQDIRRLREIQDAIENADGSPQKSAELDISFHAEIARATHNALLVRLSETASDWFEPSRHLTVQTPRRREATIAAHRRILEAIAGHDVEEAEAAMRDHIETVNDLLRQSPGYRKGSTRAARRAPR